MSRHINSFIHSFEAIYFSVFKISHYGPEKFPTLSRKGPLLLSLFVVMFWITRYYNQCLTLNHRFLYNYLNSYQYKFSCAGCNVCSIGETSRHLSTRVREHLSRDRNSHIFQHLQQSEACRRLSSNNCFSIMDTAPNRLQLILRGCMHPLGKPQVELAAQTCWLNSFVLVLC